MTLGPVRVMGAGVVVMMCVEEVSVYVFEPPNYEIIILLEILHGLLQNLTTCSIELTSGYKVQLHS